MSNARDNSTNLRGLTDYGFRGSIDATTSAFDAALAATGVLHIPSGAYSLASKWQPTKRDMLVIEHPGADFSGANKPNYSDFTNSPISNIPDPAHSSIFIRREYTAADWDTYAGNVFQVASFAETTANNMYAGGANVVALFGMGRASGAGSACWGANIASYSNNATATAIGIELNFGTLVAGGDSYGLVIHSAGFANTIGAGIQISNNSAACSMQDGIDIRWGESGYTGAALKFTGKDATSSVPYFIRVASATATTLEVDIPSLRVEATQANQISRLSIRGAASGGNTRLTVSSTDADASMMIQPRGLGTGFLSDGVSAPKFRWNQTGIGFNGSGVVAKPTITGSRGANAALASLLTALANYGLVTDSTTV